MVSMRCSSCGSAAKATCHCGVAYLPASEFAARAVAANPHKSDRAIATEIGVSADTVRRARKSTARNRAVGKRVGRDGKTRKLPQRATTVEQIAKYEAQRARAVAVAAMFGAPISDQLRAQLIAALVRLPSEHPAERLRARLGMSWDQLIIAAAAESAAA
jgi:hypothetical protein